MSNDAKPDNSPDVVTAVCRFCGGQAAGLDRLCTPCQAESACTGLTDDLTDAREKLLRWPVVTGLSTATAPIRLPAACLLPRCTGVRRRLIRARRRNHHPFKPQQKNREAKASK
jgi:hypothetical protein